MESKREREKVRQRDRHMENKSERERVGVRQRDRHMESKSEREGERGWM